MPEGDYIRRAADYGRFAWGSVAQSIGINSTQQLDSDISDIPALQALSPSSSSFQLLSFSRTFLISFQSFPTLSLLRSDRSYNRCMLICSYQITFD